MCCRLVYTHLDAALGHNRTAGDVVLALVDHHEAAECQLAFHVGRFLGRPGEVERRLGVGRDQSADGRHRPAHGQQKKKKPLMLLLLGRHD